ncbi:hypothetical protein CI109_107086 [Kwoniella shandongensis]|uniref:Beta-lactamase-related domain-containing protein n=1 Tax=Kwoniella shandongensis TaxID=1734106 RepID=A0AAJ8LPM6_9TREE
MGASRTLPTSGREKITQILEQAAAELPGCGLAICDVDGVVYEEYTAYLGEFKASRSADPFQVAVLQMVQRGELGLDTPVSEFLPQLSTPLRIFERLDDEGKPVYRHTSTEITLSMMLNQSAGFGGEFREKVVAWKSSLPDGSPGKGFVNSCKKVYQYGNACEKADIEYPVGGGGIYSTCSDYVKLLHHLLAIKSGEGKVEPTPILSSDLVSTLFAPTLLPNARKSMTALFGDLYQAKEDGELDWSTGMCLYLKDEPRGGWGRHKGSAGWMGAAGTEFWIDPDAKIAYKVKLEKAIYEALETE